eukprot:jgi/Ulvmu1/9666/UM055_0003.1
MLSRSCIGTSTCGSGSTSRGYPSVFKPLGSSSQSRQTCRARRNRLQAKQEDELDAMMAEDLQQFTTQAANTAKVPGSPNEIEDSNGLKEVVDKVLIADFFFILFILAWFVAGIGAQTLGKSTGLLDAWYSLWQLVFQPALGVLMLGALASGLLGKKDSESR